MSKSTKGESDFVFIDTPQQATPTIDKGDDNCGVPITSVRTNQHRLLSGPSPLLLNAV